MGIVYVAVCIAFILLVFSILAGVAALGISIIAVFRKNFIRSLKLFLLALALLGASVTVIYFSNGPFSRDQYSAVAIGLAFVLIFTVAVGLVTRTKES